MKFVLIVDDNDLVRNLIETILSDAGFNVITAASGAEAIDQVSENGKTIACVLQDLSMPVMPGEQIIAEMHKIEADLPVIVLSADDAGYSASRLSDLNIAGYLQKPFEADALVDKVREIVRDGG